MELTGKVVQVLPLQSGTSKAGKAWEKKEFILETKQGAFTKKVCVLLFGENVNKFAVSTGENVKVQADIESREFNGRYYTDISAWKVESEAAPVLDGAGDASGLPF